LLAKALDAAQASEQHPVGVGIVAEGELGATALLYKLGAGLLQSVGDVAGRKLDD